MIRSNFTQVALLANTKIVVEHSEGQIVKQYVFRMPTIRESTEFNFYTFLTFCILEEDKLKEWFKGVDFDSRYTLFKMILLEGGDFKKTLVPFLQRYWLN